MAHQNKSEHISFLQPLWNTVVLLLFAVGRLRLHAIVESEHVVDGIHVGERCVLVLEFVVKERVFFQDLDATLHSLGCRFQEQCDLCLCLKLLHVVALEERVPVQHVTVDVYDTWRCPIQVIHCCRHREAFELALVDLVLLLEAGLVVHEYLFVVT